MRRREFLGVFGRAAVWPLAAWGQSSMPVIGWLSVASADGMLDRVANFHAGLTSHSEQSQHWLSFLFAPRVPRRQVVDLCFEKCVGN